MGKKYFLCGIRDQAFYLTCKSQSGFGFGHTDLFNIAFLILPFLICLVQPGRNSLYSVKFWNKLMLANVDRWLKSITELDRQTQKFVGPAGS